MTSVTGSKVCILHISRPWDEWSCGSAVKPQCRLLFLSSIGNTPAISFHCPRCLSIYGAVCHSYTLYPSRNQAATFIVPEYQLKGNKSLWTLPSTYHASRLDISRLSYNVAILQTTLKYLHVSSYYTKLHQSYRARGQQHQTASNIGSKQ